jgi:hypothetical protein
MFETDYIETWASDIELFESFLLRFYNFYVTSRQDVSIQSTPLAGSDCPPLTFSIRREPISEEDFRELYGDRWRLKTFYKLRQLERSTDLPTRLKAHQIQQIMNIYNLTLQTNPDIAYPRALRALQEDFIGPADKGPLTLSTVGDIILQQAIPVKL